jgi:hypothetical protein
MPDWVKNPTSPGTAARGAKRTFANYRRRFARVDDFACHHA